MDGSPQLLAATLLPDHFRDEMRIAGLSADRDGFRFRLDPAQSFLRCGHITCYSDREFNVSISQQYRPHELLTWVTSVEVTATTLPDALREAADRASQYAPTPLWREILRHEKPEWSIVLPATRPGVVAKARAAVTARARERGIAHYLHRLGGQLVCRNNAPQAARFYSVTQLGEWSLHDGPETYPLDAPPDAAAFFANGQVVRLARQDLGRGTAVVIPLGPAPSPPSPRPPRWQRQAPAPRRYPPHWQRRG